MLVEPLEGNPLSTPNRLAKHTMGRFDNIERVRYARFRKPGDTVAGVVTSIEEVTLPDIVDGRIVGPRFNVDGTVLTQTDIRLDVDGEITVLHARTMVGLAIQEALVKAKADDLYVGDHLSITYVTDEDANEDITAKVYEAVVKPGKK